MIGLFYDKGMGGIFYSLRIGDVKAIRSQLAEINEWKCIVNMGKSMGTKRDQPKLEKLDIFLRTCEDRKTLEKFKLNISTGGMGCIMCAETEDELEKMREIVLSVPKFNTDYRDKICALFDKLTDYLRSGETDRRLFIKIANMQHITSGIARDGYLD